MTEVSMTLYNIDREIVSIINNADENGEIDSAAFDALQMAKKDKVLNIVRFMSSMSGNVEMIEAEMERLRVLKKAIEKRNDSLKEYVKRSMEIEGITKLDLGTFVVSVCNNAPSLVVDDENKIDPKFKKVVETVSIDKMAIKDAMKSGEIIDGCHLQSSTSLRIK